MEIMTALSRRAVMSLMAGGAAAGAGVLTFASPAFAAYPEHSVKVLVPFAPGGPTDVMARLIAAKMSEDLGEQFYVDNQAGAGGNIAMGAAARAAPDGFTMLVVSSSFMINPGLYHRVPYDPFKDFAPISVAGDSPQVFIVHPSVPAKNMKELIDLVKSHPGKYNYASPGAGTGPHLSAELLKLTFGLDLTHVPFRGGAPCVQSVMGGFNPIGCVSLPPAVQLIRSGQIRALGLTSPKRFPTVPDVPTLEEQGLHGQESTTIGGFLMPAGTRKEIIDTLYKEIVKIVNGPGMNDRFAALGFTPIANSPEEFAGLIRKEVARWTKVIKDAKIELM